MAPGGPSEDPRPFPDRIIGRPLARFDAGDKVQGTTLYAADWRLPGMLIGRILRSVYPSARIRRIMVERARTLPGVAAVLTADDVPSNALHEDPTGFGLTSFATPILAAGRARYQGEPLALVAADSDVHAHAALEAIEVDYEPLPGVFDMDEALRPGAPRIHAGPLEVATGRHRGGVSERGRDRRAHLPDSAG
jgi:CO/xanthine dehydrogenase Mo-binding subunit